MNSCDCNFLSRLMIFSQFKQYTVAHLSYYFHNFWCKTFLKNFFFRLFLHMHRKILIHWKVFIQKFSRISGRKEHQGPLIPHISCFIFQYHFTMLITTRLKSNFELMEFPRSHFYIPVAWFRFNSFYHSYSMKIISCNLQLVRKVFLAVQFRV